MSPIERFVIAAVVLLAGAVIGWLIRRRLQPSPDCRLEADGLPVGLVLVTVPYCTRCSSLRARLTTAGIEFTTIDAGSHPMLLRTIEISTAPTLLRVATSGRLIDRESRNFSDPRLTAMALPTD